MWSSPAPAATPPAQRGPPRVRESFHIGIPCSCNCSRRRRPKRPRSLGGIARGARLQMRSIRGAGKFSGRACQGSVRLPDHRSQHDRHERTPASAKINVCRSGITGNLHFSVVSFRRNVTGASFRGSRLSDQADRRRCFIQAHHFRSQSTVKDRRFNLGAVIKTEPNAPANIAIKAFFCRCCVSSVQQQMSPKEVNQVA